MYGDPATVSDMAHQAPLRTISGYAPAREATCVGNDFVQTAGWVRDLGIYLDSEFT